MAIRLRMKTPTEVRRVLVRVSNMVVNGQIEAKEANSIISACNAVLSAIRIDEQQKKIEELEQKISEFETTRKEGNWF